MCLRGQLSGFYTLFPWAPGTKIQSSSLHAKFLLSAELFHLYVYKCVPICVHAHM